MDKNFLDVVNNNLSVSLKKVNIINVKRSFTIDNYYDIDNTIIFPISGNFRYGKYKKIISNEDCIFIPAHSTVSLSFGSKRTKTLAPKMNDTINKKEKTMVKATKKEETHCSFPITWKQLPKKEDKEYIYFPFYWFLSFISLLSILTL